MTTWATKHLDALKNSEISPPPVVQTLKLGTLDEWGEGWIRKNWKPSPDLLNRDGSLFGGYVAALADQALALAAMTVVPPDCLFRTLNLQLNFVRVGQAQPLSIEAKVEAMTKQLITVRADILRDDGKLIANASAQQFILPFEAKSS